MTKKAVQVILSDNREITMHEPRTDELGTFLRAMPAIIAVSEAGKSFADGGFQTVKLDDSQLAGLWGLIASLSGLGEDEVKALPLWDGFGLIQSIGELIPTNFFPQKKTGENGGNGSEEEKTQSLQDGQMSTP